MTVIENLQAIDYVEGFSSHKRAKQNSSEGMNQPPKSIMAEVKRLPQPLTIKSSHVTEGSVPLIDAEPKTPSAHIPTLKGVGKSDCQVRIVEIVECEHDIALGAFGDTNPGLCNGQYHALLEV